MILNQDHILFSNPKEIWNEKEDSYFLENKKCQVELIYYGLDKPKVWQKKVIIGKRTVCYAE